MTYPAKSAAATAGGSCPLARRDRALIIQEPAPILADTAPRPRCPAAAASRETRRRRWTEWRSRQMLIYSNVAGLTVPVRYTADYTASVP